jgi:hypothetical protein
MLPSWRFVKLISRGAERTLMQVNFPGGGKGPKIRLAGDSEQSLGA